jgi:hypothetical protein
MLRSRLALVVVAAAVSAGSGAAYAATHGSAHPTRPPVTKTPSFPSNLHYPCHSHGAKLTPAQV